MDGEDTNTGAKGADVTFDKSTEQAFCSFYRNIDEKAEGTVRLFERAGGDYYTAHGDDAIYVAETVYKTSSVLKYMGSGNSSIPYCSISKLNAISLIRDLLLIKHKKVEIWEADGTRTKNASNFRLGRKASPGNLLELEDLVFANAASLSSSPVILALKAFAKGEQKVVLKPGRERLNRGTLTKTLFLLWSLQFVGAAFTDATTMHQIGLAEFADNDTFSNLESLLIQMSVKECLIPDDKVSYENRKVLSILERCSIVATTVKKNLFDSRDAEQDIDRLLAEGTSLKTLPEFELRTAISSACCLIKYLGLLGDESNFGQYTLKSFDLSQYMRLDASAIKALNLMPQAQEGAKKNSSLYGLLNHTKTAQGARLLAQWLRQPLMNLTEIEMRQNLVETFINDSELRQTLQEEVLKRFPDLHRMGKKFLRGNANLQDVVRLYQVVISLPRFLEVLNEHEGEYRWLVKELYVVKLEEYIDSLAKLQDLVETTIDLEAAENHEYMIKGDFDPQLNEVRVAKQKLEKQLIPEATRVADDLGVDLEKKLKLENNSVYGWHLRLTKSDAARIRGKREYIELSTQKAGVLFVTSKLKRLSSEIEELRSQYDSLQSNLVKEIIHVAAGYFPVLDRLNQVISHVDVIASFAHTSVNAPTQYVRPKLTKRSTGDLILKQCRHPCLEVQDGVSFIANDVEMKRDSSMFNIVTGPNMGGKSTYIRQVGVVVLMAQAGCFVPCSQAEFPVLDAILCRVGAGDSQLKGVSTFMAEMLETAAILRASTQDSLIIIDELGRGTSTYDGFGLAWAISEHIAKKINCFALFASHFHELTALSEEVLTVKNLHVAARADEKAITLLYRVKEGACDQSFGIHVAELAAFPDPVVRLAKRKACELEDFSTDDTKVKAQKTNEEEKAESDEIIETVLAEFKEQAAAISIAPQDDIKAWNEKALKVVEALKEKYQARVEAHPYLRELISSLA
ncbi:MutS-like protein [Phlyctochytrium bullatum]|nr:MutS-like protein [Phlyctochytrium bullatum]